MKFNVIPATCLITVLATPSLSAANDDGFFNISYNNIGFELTQIGGYGELVVKPQGFGKMAYGTCSVNFKRSADGAVTDMTPVVQGSSATCPEQLAFTVTPSAKGMYKIKFSAGGDLAGNEFELFPVLRPMSPEFEVKAPKGFDILGQTIGMTRTEIETALSSDGYQLLEGYTAKSEYTDGTVKYQVIFAKGEQDTAGRPEDSIAITYTTVVAGNEENARVEALGRHWNIPASANLSVANLKKSLSEKHGEVTSGFDARYYNRAGELQPKAFQNVCADDVHLQQVSTALNFLGSGEELAVSPSCGASVDVMVIESYETKGLASMLKVSLRKGDVAYGAFWESWSKRESQELQKRYDIQAGMTTTAPKL